MLKFRNLWRFGRKTHHNRRATKTTSQNAPMVAIETMEPRELMSAANVAQVGVFREGHYFWDTGARGFNGESSAAFGRAGDIPIAGDWDGDGFEEAGVFRNGQFLLDTGARGSQGEQPIAFGLPGDLPIAGDWNGDGRDEVGVFRNGQFYLDLGAPGYQNEQPFAFGLAGDRPIAGDWDGNGTDEVGVFRNGQFFLDVGAPGYQNEQPFAFGLAGDRPIAGDWDGNGTDEVGVFRNGQFVLDVGDRGYQNEQPFAFGLAGDQPFAGNSGPTRVISRPSYDYVPTVMVENGTYRMWWCGGVNGDSILYSESTNPNGGWSAPRTVFSPTGSARDFDGQHVCDPSVIKVDGVYYMYYGGFPTEGSPLAHTTNVGLATSSDGIRWTRANNGQPIISPRNFTASSPHQYGAGQPSATVVDGQVYLTFHDSTAPAANPGNGGGVYVIRSGDPRFAGAVEELTATGFVRRGSTRELELRYKLFDAVSVDWQYSDRANSFLMSVHGIAGISSVLSFDRNFQQIRQVNLENVRWTEGPGIAHLPNGHSLDSSTDQPLSWQVFYSTGAANPETWDLAYSEFTLPLNQVSHAPPVRTDVTLDMNSQVGGNNGRTDTIVAQVSGSQLQLLVNGQIVSSTDVARVQSLTIMGSNDADVITVAASVPSSIAVRLNGGGGNDTLTGGLGNDSLDGGTGNDDLRGGNGNDFLIGMAGNDSLYGQAGDDRLEGTDGNDLLCAGIGNDLLFGGRGRDNLVGQEGNDQLDGGEDADTLCGCEGNDLVRGGDGNDILYGESGNDTLLGDAGNDLLDGGTDQDVVFGGEGNDSLIGGAGNDVLAGGNGNDTLRGGIGNDTLLGGDGSDQLYGEAGRDVLSGEAGNDTLDGGADLDSLYGGAGTDRLGTISRGEFSSTDGVFAFDLNALLRSLP